MSQLFILLNKLFIKVGLDYVSGESEGLSSVIGVILIIAVVVALVVGVSFIVFDIGEDVDSPPDATVSVEQSSDGIDIQVIRNENADELILVGPNGFTKEISESAGSSTRISAPEFGKYSLVAGSINDGDVLDSVVVEEPNTSTVSGVLEINPDIPDQEIISKDSDGRIIDTTRTGSDGGFTVESTDSGTIVANVEGFTDYSSISTVSNDLYTSKQVSVSSVEDSGGIQFTPDGEDVVTLSNSTGSKVDVLFESASGETQVGNPWQLEASKELSGRDITLINDIEADKQSFVSFNDNNPVTSHAEVDRSENQVNGIPELSFTWINVGQADSILVQSENGDNMLIDTGDFTDDGQTTLDYLQKSNVETVDHLVASHQDADHIGGHESVIENFGSSGIGNVYDNGVPRSTNTAEEYVNAVSNEGLSITEVEQGDIIQFEGAEVKVLNPKNIGDSGEQGSDNDMVVLKITHGDNDIFLGGDVESESESRIVDANSGDLDVELMDVPHHGSSTSSSNKLLNELNPEKAVISAPFDSQFGHPTDEVVSRYESRNVDIFWTAANGNVTAVSDGSDIQASVEKGDVNDVTKESNYEISVQSVDSSVEQGSTVNVDFNVANTGNVPDIQDIEMIISGQSDPVDEEKNVKLVESESVSKTLSWTTSYDQEIKDYTIIISTEDESVNRTVSVTEETVTNSLKNPSFESGSDTDADNWVEVEIAGSGRTSAFAFDGTESIAMKDLTSGYGSRTLKSSPVSVTEGDSYNFGAYYYLPSAESEFSSIESSDYRYKIELAWFDSSGTEIGDEQVSDDTSAFDSWEKVTVSGTVPSGAVEAKLRIDAYEDNDNNGNIYWDSTFLNSG